MLRREMKEVTMRKIHALPLVAAIALAACSGGTEEESATAGEGLSEAEANAAAEGAIRLTPGQYSTTLELVEFEVPGLSGDLADQIRDLAASGFAEGNSFCLTPEEAEEGPRRMVRDLAENDCTFNKFDVAGGTINADLSCIADDGSEGTMKMTGTMTSESSDMMMEMDQQIPQMGKAHMKVKVNSRRVGECS
ncbi:hypothetical protein FHS61_001582 [Altererythrobacter atlanticus]|uniref:Uncharacterized protein n=1 Tax=Croceibacterium atlanticum TaxID=1267766 RepID=A0A0F7KYF9_9SPHN|nr:DUF3617 domain-containing protein [Croceibacterium atlanticum]AKH44262.1 hypothetical protein WYH_03243 [Croceibacterium atlanticum]MBB5732573.1 hypothetical protein [Croceibacterium atlanticum]